jgi:hypothetical protein
MKSDKADGSCAQQSLYTGPTAPERIVPNLYKTEIFAAFKSEAFDEEFDAFVKMGDRIPPHGTATTGFPAPHRKVPLELPLFVITSRRFVVDKR